LTPAVTPDFASEYWIDTFSKFATLANADTGSEIDLISLDYCWWKCLRTQNVGFKDSQIQFADGSLAFLQGKVDVQITFHRTDGERMVRTFYVLENLTCDMLFGEDFLDETDAFETYKEFYMGDDDDLAQVNTGLSG
jgi:hypothetical protein